MKKNVIISSAFIVLSNIIILFGVIFLGWNFKDIILLFWLETGFIGLFLGIKVLIISSQKNRHHKKGKNNKLKEKVGVIIFSFIFILCLFYIFYQLSKILIIFLNVNIIDLYSLRYLAYLLLFSHLISFILNFLFNKEYKKKNILSPIDSFIEMSKRIVFILSYISLIAVIFYFLPMISNGEYNEGSISIIILSSFVFLKSYFDLKFNIKENSPIEKEKFLDSNTLLSEIKR